MQTITLHDQFQAELFNRIKLEAAILERGINCYIIRACNLHTIPPTISAITSYYYVKLYKT